MFSINTHPPREDVQSRPEHVVVKSIWLRSVYRYPPHNDVSVNDGPHIRRWSYNIIPNLVLQLPAVFSTVTHCTGLLPGSNRLYHVAEVCNRLSICTIWVCVSTLYDFRTTTKSPNDAFLRTYPPR